MKPSPAVHAYADALVALGLERGVLDRLEADVALATALIAGDPETLVFWESPGVDREEKKRVLRETLGGAVCAEMMDFLCVLLDKKREGLIRYFEEEFLHVADEAAGRVRVTVQAAGPLPPDTVRRWEAAFTADFGRKAIVQAEVAPELMAGARFAVGDLVLDASVRGRMNQFKRELGRK
ncbi:MAG: ATP synthase F1 subunit delta [Planctomycetota bacterium]